MTEFIYGCKKSNNGIFHKIVNFLIRIRFLLAVVLDVIDFLTAWNPIINPIWDVVCFLFLLVTLRNKMLASSSLVELLFVGYPPFSVFDAFLPICTILTFLDASQKKVYFAGKI